MIAAAAPGLASAAAPALVGTVASRSVVDSGNQLVLTVPAAGVAAGHTVVVVGSKGKDQEAVASVTDSRGNVYQVDRQLHGPVNSGMSMTVVSGYVATALQAGDSVTLTYEGAAAYTNRFGAAYDFSGLAQGSFDSATNTGGYGSNVTTGTVASSQDGDLVFGLFELQSGAATFTPESGLNALPQVIGGVVGETLQPVWKVAGAAGLQSASGTTSAFLSWYGIAVTYKAGAAAPPPPTPPANTAPPVVSGTTREGATLVASTGTWTGTAPLSYAYQWQRCPSGGGACANVGANNASYTLVTADVGATIQAAVTATNAAGSATATSAATAAIAPLPTGTVPAFVQTIDARSVTDGASNTLALAVPAAGVAAGDTVLVVGAKGNDQAAIASVADTKGNVYRVDRQLHGAAGSGLSMTIVSGHIATALQPGDTITITYEGTTTYSNRFGAAYEFSGLQTNAADVQAGSGGYGTLVSTGQTASTAQANELVFGLFEAQPLTTPFTAGTGLAALPQASGSVVGLTLQPVYGVVTSTGPQQATGTFGGLVSWYGMVVTYRAGAGTPATPPANAVAPAITGTARDGSTLTADPGTWTGTAPIAYAYQWQRCAAGGGSCTNVGTGSTYALGAADVGSSITLAVTGTNGAGSAVATATGVTVMAAPPANTAAPGVSGTTVVGATLTGTNGTWTGTAPITYTSAWQRCDAAGASCAGTGVTTSTYTVAVGDVGSTLRIVVTATNSAGVVAATSATTGVVTSAVQPTGPRFVQDLGAPALTDSANNQLVFMIPAGGVAVGDKVVLAASKGSGTYGVLSVGDSRGNTYTVDANARGGAGSGVGFGIASGDISTALSAGDRITVTFEGTTGYTNRWGIAYDFAGLATGGADVSATGTGYGTAVTVGPTAATTAAKELVLGAFNVQAAAPSFTAGAAFQTLTSTSTSVLNQSLLSEFQIVTTTGTQRTTGALASAQSYIGAVVTYRSAAGPTNTGAPAISGGSTVGSTLTATTGTWTSPGTISYSYQWQRCDASGAMCALLPDATGPSYVVASGDVGGTLRVVVTASDSSGSTAAVSARTAVVTGGMSATPPVTTGLQLWFEANSETVADGARLSTWHDRSGNGRDLSASLPEQAPVFHANALNGRAAIEFDGVSSLLKTYGSTFTIAQPSTFFIVYRSLDTNTATRAFVFDSTNSTLRQAMGRPSQNAIRIYADADLDFGGLTYPFAGFQAWAGIFNDTASSLWRNGQLVGSGTAGASVLRGFAVGGLSTTGNGGYDMGHTQIAEILYYAGALSAADRQSITNWLNLKYALF